MQAGDIVAAGDALVVLEAMKMETVVRAEVDGRVREVVTRANEQVGAGRALLVLEPVELADSAAPASRADFATLVAEGGSATLDHDGCAHELDELHGMVLGFDVMPPAALRAGRRCGEPPVSPEERRRREDEILSAFVDVAALFRRAPADDDADFGRSSTSEYLFTYLRDLRKVGRGLPRLFVDQLRRTLRHYGVESLDPSLELEQALYRIAQSQQGMDQHVGSVLALLEGRLDHAAEHHDDASWRLLLDRIVAETRQRWPGVHDLAQELHYRTFDQSLLEEIRAEAYRQATEARQGTDQRTWRSGTGSAHPGARRLFTAAQDRAVSVVRRRCALAATGPARGDDPAVLPHGNH